MHVIYMLLSCAVGLGVGLGLIVFLRAFTAKAVTGKWPHEDTEAEAVFRLLP